MSSEAVAIPIDEVMALVRENKIRLKKVDVKPEARKPGAPIARYFWNNETQPKGSLQIVIGDAYKPKNLQPFLLKKPSKFQGGPGTAESQSDSFGAFTSIACPEESRHWLDFTEWIAQQVLAAGIVMKLKSKTEPETNIDEVKRVLAEVAMESSTGGGTVCLSQKFQMGGKIPELRTKFHYFEEEEAEDGEKTVVIGDEFDGNTLDASRNIFSIVELGELKFTQAKWRSMLYAREVFAFPLTNKVATTFKMGRRIMDYSEAPAAKRRKSNEPSAADDEGGYAQDLDQTQGAPESVSAAELDPMAAYGAALAAISAPEPVAAAVAAAPAPAAFAAPVEPTPAPPAPRKGGKTKIPVAAVTDEIV